MSSVSLDELKKRAIVQEKPNDFTLKMWLRATEKTYQSSQEAIQKGKAADSYVLLLRFLSLILEVIPAHRDFSKTDGTYQNLRRMAPAAMEALESLKDKLAPKGSVIDKQNTQPAAPAAPAASPMAKPEAPATTPKVAPLNIPQQQRQQAGISPSPIAPMISPLQPSHQPQPYAVPLTPPLIPLASPLVPEGPLTPSKFVLSYSSRNNGTITSEELAKALLWRASVLIVDTRPRRSFLTSHVNAPCVNIDPEVLDFASSAEELVELLEDDEEKRAFQNRDQFDYVVLVDNTPSAPALRTMRDLFALDFAKELRCPPLALEQGFPHFQGTFTANCIMSQDSNHSMSVDDDFGFGEGDLAEDQGTMLKDQPPSDMSETAAAADPFPTLPVQSEEVHPDHIQRLTIADIENMIKGATPFPVATSSAPSSVNRSPHQLLFKSHSALGMKNPSAKNVFDNPYHFLRASQPTPIPPVIRKPPQPQPQPTPIQPPRPTPVPNLTPIPKSQPLVTPTPMARPPPPRSPSTASMENSRPVLADVSGGVIGLNNLGNTCFLNSSIQCLSCTLPLTRVFLDGSFKKWLNPENPLGTGGALAKVYGALMNAMWKESRSTLSPVQFKETMAEFAPQFSGFQQHDTQEFLSFLLDGLHEDLNLVKTKPIVEDPDGGNLPLETLAKISWENYLKRNDSIIVKTFQGQLKSTLTCMECGKESNTFNPFMFLTLPVSAGGATTLDKCLARFTECEYLEEADCWKCPQCKRYCRAKKQLTLWKLPPILLIHLKRFSFSGPWRDKIETWVDFPFRNLDLSTYLGKTGTLPKYDLFAVSNHFGGLNGGHYTACSKHPYQQKWYNYDDNYIRPLKEEDVKSNAAYILFYVQQGL